MTTGSRKTDPLIGTVVADRYLILDLVGRGGMGVVYKARHEMMDRVVAIKMLLPQLCSDEAAAARFQREARAASRINHPNIIALHDFGRTNDGLPYLVMDYIEGESLADILKREGQLGVTRTATIFPQVCDALAHAHDLGIIHRDLKPANIMLVSTSDERDTVKVVDFGIAKMYESDDADEMQRLTTTGELFGSPVYMSPEQCAGQQLDARSDIYSLGCVMYETLTGKLPCVGKTVLETISRQLNSKAPTFSEARPDLYIPDWIEQVVFRAIEKEPSKRQQTMRDMQHEINVGVTSHSTASMRAYNPNNPSVKTRVVSSTSQRAIPASVQRRAESPSPLKPAMVVVGLAVAVILAIGGFAFSTMMSKKTNTPSPEPQIQQPEPTPTSTIEEPQKPVVKPIAKTKIKTNPKGEVVRQVEKTVVKQVVHQKPVTHASIAADTSTPTPPPSKRKRQHDFYDYQSKHEHVQGDPVSLPVKDWSAD